MKTDYTGNKNDYTRIEKQRTKPANYSKALAAMLKHKTSQKP